MARRAMQAMLLDRTGGPLRAAELPRPTPGPGQVLVRVAACGVCRTDLHVHDGELPRPKLPLVLGHEVAGRVEELGDGVVGLAAGDRVGVPWLARTCGACEACGRGDENLCEAALFTGYTVDGGYAELLVADARSVFPLPDGIDDLHAAPLLCAGLIGFRAYRRAGAAERLGLYGFGGAAHLLAQLARAEGRRVFAFTRPGDRAGQAFARELGAEWAGGSEESPPEPLDAAILFAPVGELVPLALRAVRPGGRVICAGIHMSMIPAFPYEILWRERELVSVANLTRADGLDYFAAIRRHPVRPRIQVFPLRRAGVALQQLRLGRIEGIAVLDVAAAKADDLC